MTAFSLFKRVMAGLGPGALGAVRAIKEGARSPSFVEMRMLFCALS